MSALCMRIKLRKLRTFRNIAQDARQRWEQLNLKWEQHRIKMAERAEPPCPCTHPEDPQFKYVTKKDQTAIRGKRLLWHDLF